MKLLGKYLVSISLLNLVYMIGVIKISVKKRNMCDVPLLVLRAIINEVTRRLIHLLPIALVSIRCRHVCQVPGLRWLSRLSHLPVITMVGVQE